jgi:hypothetical protein
MEDYPVPTACIPQASPPKDARAGRAPPPGAYDTFSSLGEQQAHFLRCPGCIARQFLCRLAPREIAHEDQRYANACNQRDPELLFDSQSSHRPTSPAYSWSRAVMGRQRVSGDPVYISPLHTAEQRGRDSPGPQVWALTILASIEGERLSWK